ncbi:MAG TPA: DNA cytosine methyltransferase [Caulobacteraceae bacterium]|jgi:DNA (cytosine-5)-methyltransferase 1|nr:DNA cytosine methyltransferase [Caulobacteraceae bacterium]
MPKFYEFFAGGGMARVGLGPKWKCLFANDFDDKKGRIYRANFPSPNVLKVGDVRQVDLAELRDVADLVWGSFPCQDLSLAGGGAGLRGERSGTFYPFWNVISRLIDDGRAPKVIALENVCGTLTSHGGKDFQAICQTYVKAGYRFGALVINADEFVPQSRPRLFVVGVRNDVPIPRHLVADCPSEPYHTNGLQRAVSQLRAGLRSEMIWWNVPQPSARRKSFADIIEEHPTSVSWHSASETRQLLAMMSSLNRAKVAAAKGAGSRVVGGIYRRTRFNENNVKVQRAEVRFDDVAGCLRTPAGGSSRQIIMVVDGPIIRTRLISARETARLMGLSEGYILPDNYNEAYHLTGDGVAVPVVRHLARHLFEPIIEQMGETERRAA